LSRQEFFELWSAGHGGYDPRGSLWVRGWLGLVHALTRPLVHVRTPPDLITLLAGLAALGAAWAAGAGGRWLVAAALLVGLSGLLDSMDGAVAVICRRATRWGALLDSVVDRVADACLLVALWSAGAGAWPCLGAWLLLVLLEYSRVRAGALGVPGVVVVTVGERPTRMIVVAMFLLAAGLLPGTAVRWAQVGSYVLVAAGVVAVVQLLIALRPPLSGHPGQAAERDQ
jgi:CDP-diacylglycerol--glycerol-3-phosphate 3-phosphatidyltransferase